MSTLENISCGKFLLLVLICMQTLGGVVFVFCAMDFRRICTRQCGISRASFDRAGGKIGFICQDNTENLGAIP